MMILDHRLLLRVTVKALARLAAQVASVDHLAQQSARPVLVAEVGVQHLHDAEAGVEANKVPKGEGPHRVVEPELADLVNVGGVGADALEKHLGRLVDEGHQGAVGYKAEGVLALDRSLCEGKEERGRRRRQGEEEEG